MVLLPLVVFWCLWNYRVIPVNMFTVSIQFFVQGIFSIAFIYCKWEGKKLMDELDERLYDLRLARESKSDALELDT